MLLLLLLLLLVVVLVVVFDCAGVFFVVLSFPGSGGGSVSDVNKVFGKSACSYHGVFSIFLHPPTHPPHTVSFDSGGQPLDLEEQGRSGPTQISRPVQSQTQECRHLLNSHAPSIHPSHQFRSSVPSHVLFESQNFRFLFFFRFQFYQGLVFVNRASF
jgi:hypothetical protein